MSLPNEILAQIGLTDLESKTRDEVLALLAQAEAAITHMVDSCNEAMVKINDARGNFLAQKINEDLSEESTLDVIRPLMES